MKKFSTIPLIFSLCIFIFSGCTFTNIGIDGLLVSPTISDEQSHIFDALVTSVGKDIQLKYPLSGENRSAVIIENIDDDISKEAIVFYKKSNPSANETGLRINILDEIDGEWQSVYDLPALAQEIDKVIISNIGASNEKYIIVGYGSKTQIDKKFVVYSYSNKILNPIYNDDYTILEILDMDLDGKKEVVTSYRSQLDKRFYIKLSKVFGNQDEENLSVELSTDVASVSSMTAGIVGEDTNALYIDAVKSDGTMITEVVGIVDNGLKNLITDTEMSLKTVRPWGFNSYDIDKDGQIEIPSSKPFLGYASSTSAKDIVLQTQWLTVDLHGNISHKLSSYYSKSNSYIFILPQGWDKLVTAKIDTAKNEIVFYKYAGDINEEMQEILRIMTVPHFDADEYIKDGYKVLKTKGQIDYLYKITSGAEDNLMLTKSMLEDNFIVLYGGN